MSAERVPTATVTVVPISTYQGHAIPAAGARKGNSVESGLAKTIPDITTSPVAIPMITSRPSARFDDSARKKLPRSAP